MHDWTVRLLVLAIAVSLALAAPVATAQSFVFTAIPDEDETRLQERFDQVAAYLSAQLDTPVRYVPVKSYAAAVTAFRNNQVQLAWFGGLSGVRARAMVPDSIPLAQGVEDTRFRSYFIAHRDTGLQPSDELPEALRGMSFTFGSKGSTSGRLMPEHFLRERFGETPNEIFRRVGFSGNHTRTIALVESGAYDVGALSFTAWQIELENDRIDTDAVEVIWQTPQYPNYQWTIRGDVDARFGAGFTERVREALLAMDDPELLALFPREGFIAVSEDAYDPLRDQARALGLID